MLFLQYTLPMIMRKMLITRLPSYSTVTAFTSYNCLHESHVLLVRHIKASVHHLWYENVRFLHSQRNKKFSCTILVHRRAPVLRGCWRRCQPKSQSHWTLEEVVPASGSKVVEPTSLTFGTGAESVRAAIRKKLRCPLFSSQLVV